MQSRYRILADFLETKANFENYFNFIEEEPETGDFVTSSGLTRNQELEALNDKLAHLEDDNPWIVDVLDILEGD